MPNGGSSLIWLCTTPPSSKARGGRGVRRIFV
jgi:hypothetical protein